MLASSEELGSPFLKNGFRILAGPVGQDNLISTLNELGSGSVTLRYTMDPKKYWKVRREIESQLEGKKKVDLFKGKDYLVLERI